ncbi:unnamed protein product [Ostreobium quekettii]|uniref:SRPBCC family protein n=1 Tax=Ostreobium quekettii TaxID=121088 RepID=A0A8S1J464_9CHLO|nr:unnamed protein product [Ostreobium quekettii]
MFRATNVHERAFAAPPRRVGSLIDSLASPSDALWPKAWPPVHFDRPLAVGAKGGHGSIRYFVEAYTPGASVKFRFTSPAGFDGHHAFEVVALDAGSALLRHRVEVALRGWGVALWHLAVRPLHDAAIEDCLSTGRASLGLAPEARRWSLWVRLLRWAARVGRLRAGTDGKVGDK